MVTSLAQAMRIQRARVSRGQKGHSKAVRRFLKRGLDLGGMVNGNYAGGKAGDHIKYLSAKEVLPYIGNFPFPSKHPMSYMQNGL